VIVLELRLFAGLSDFMHVSGLCGTRLLVDLSGLSLFS